MINAGGLAMERESDTYIRPQPLIAVRNVRASSQWYRRLLQAESLPEHEHRDVYDRIFYDGQLILQLHAWDEENHPNLVNPDTVRAGHGVVLWFEVNEFDAAVGRARSLGAEIAEEPRVNLQAQHKEIWIRDPDGYMVVLAGPDGET
jgi:catechol 2,3-dioxygenase-like lactoylglutathione lyase family enzyme